MRTRILPLGVVLAMAAAGCDVKVNDKGEVDLEIVEGRASDVLTKTYTLPKDGQLEVFNALGSLEAFPATGSQVEVIVTREVRARSDEAAQQLLAGLQLEEEVTPNTVKVQSRRTEGTRGFRQNVRLEYRVNLPPGLNVSLKSENGVMRLENIRGRITASATNGAINGRGLAGPLEASIVNGSLMVNLASVTGDIRLSSVNGAIRLFLPADANATIDARAVNGGVVVQDDVPLKTTVSERLHVSGTLNKGGPKIDLQSTNGPIRISAAGADRPSEISPELRERDAP
jgi:hypothetical protein